MMMDERQFWEVETVDCPDCEATWFIDPPYQGTAGRWYFNCELDYNYLSNWVKSRRGQIIACESPDANWLPFRKLSGSSFASIGKRKLNEGVFLTDE